MSCISKSTNQPVKLQIHLALPGFLISQKKGEFPKNINQHLQKHSHKNFETNISSQENHFLPGRRKRVFQAAREFLKGQRKIPKFCRFPKILLSWTNIIWGDREWESNKEHIKNIHHLSFKNPKFQSPVCIVFFQGSYHPAGLWGQGEPSSKQHCKRRKNKN